jgi:hypothetical protein
VIKISGLLDLDSLSIQITDIGDKLEKVREIKTKQKLVSQILCLLRNRDEYYYQFSHGGAATGYNFFSGDLINKCTKVQALINLGKIEEASDNIKEVIDNIRKIVDTIDSDSNFRVPNPAVMYFYKPPDWMNANTYFVSYAHKDSISRSIIPLMRSKIGSLANLWIDEYDLKRHQQLPIEISKAIEKSNAAIVFTSKNFFESKWCNEEWQSLFMKRLSEPQYRLYLIRIDDEEYPPLLTTFYYTDCRNFPEPRAKVELGKLLKEIENYELFSRFPRRKTR